MNRAAYRQIVVEGFIAVAVCIGARMMWVQPKAAKLHEIETTIQQTGVVTPQLVEDTVPRIAEQASVLAAKVKEVSTRSRDSRDSAQIYRRITELARRHGVVVHSLSPGDRPATRKDDEATPTIARITLEIDGSYESMARFLEAMDSAAGYLRAASLELSVQGFPGENLVHARLSCETLSFPIPPALAAMQGEADAER